MGLGGYLGENTSESHIFHKKVKVSPFPPPLIFFLFRLLKNMEFDLNVCHFIFRC